MLFFIARWLNTGWANERQNTSETLRLLPKLLTEYVLLRQHQARDFSGISSKAKFCFTAVFYIVFQSLFLLYFSTSCSKLLNNDTNLYVNKKPSWLSASQHSLSSSSFQTFLLPLFFMHFPGMTFQILSDGVSSYSLLHIHCEALQKRDEGGGE